MLKLTDVVTALSILDADHEVRVSEFDSPDELERTIIKLLVDIKCPFGVKSNEYGTTIYLRD